MNLYEKQMAEINNVLSELIGSLERLSLLMCEDKKESVQPCAKKPATLQILSHRECEVIYWSSIGKTYQETAIILGNNYPQ
ncbi:AHL-dependent transcriptional regulator [Serratia sp. M24T3]|uniref:AHL-dependent transcriptional regulator n=1 Tax=Serratia sp. M24T3 TaxID=932213 RepID=UPI00025B93BD|nr:AHL-dependent transcriptional regulator [Serratia sp. M24T3]EIC84187.1 AHL-dependent transcriptional regulator [Serratia sp. M24T3]